MNAEDRDRLHNAVKRAAVVLAVSWVLVPIVVGMASGSALIGAVAFGVWVSMSSVAFGIWASSRAAASIPAAPAHRSVTSNPVFTPEGWALPRRVCRLPDPPRDEAHALDRLRLFWARVAAVLSVLAFVVALSLGIGNEPSLGITTVVTTGYGLVLAVGALWWTAHNLKQGEPRPVLDRPATFVGFLAPFLFAFALLYGMTLVPSHGSPPVQWLLGDVLALLIFLAYLTATGMWIRVTGRRWRLSYAVTSQSHH